jgi:NADPH:quinone reductase-like Zn-dependent oxidoreductase
MTSNSPKTMRAVGFKRFGAAAKNLEALEVPKPTITNPDDIIVKVKATALNPSDGARPTGYTRLIETVKYFPFYVRYPNPND